MAANTSSSAIPSTSSSSSVASSSTSSSVVSSSTSSSVVPVSTSSSSVISSSSTTSQQSTTTAPISTSSSVIISSTSSIAPVSSSSSTLPASSTSSSTVVSSSSTSAAPSTTSNPGTIYSTSYVYVTATNSQGSTYSTASGVVATSGSHGKSNTNVGAIVGGVVGGVCGIALIAGLVFFLLRRKSKANRGALDEKMFDPSRSANHPSLSKGPADLLSNHHPAAHEVSPFTYGAAGVAGLGAGATAYGASHNGYGSEDPYAQPAALHSGAMTNDGYNGYGYPDNANGGGEMEELGSPTGINRYSGGWGAAAALGAGAGAGAAGGAAYGGYHARSPSDGQTRTSSEGYPTSPPSQSGPRMSAAALAKHREAQSYRSTSNANGHGRNPSYDQGFAGAGPSGVPRTTATSSSGSDYGGAQSGVVPMTPYTDGASSNGRDPDEMRRSSAASAGGGSNVVVHEDGGRVPDVEEGDEEEGPVELPPTYHSIPAGRQE